MLLQNARLSDGSTADVRLDGDRIAEVRPAGASAEAGALDLTGYVLLGAPAEPHAHLDKALTADRVHVQAGDLDSAIEAWHEHRRTLTVEDVARRAEAAARTCLSRGATAVRTHVDVGEGIELRAARALIEVRERLRPLMDIQVVALTYPLAGPAGAENRELLRGALQLGVDVVGGAPHIDADPVGHIRVCLDLAAEFERPVDLHMDEHMRPLSMDLADLARMTAAGLPQPVTASHCVSLGLQSAAVQDRLAGDVARAGLAVISCPATNLHLQARDVRTATPRGITALKALLDAGVTVAGGGDNVQDFFHPLGCGDPLHTAGLLVLGGQLDIPTAYRLVSEGAREAIGLPAAVIAPGRPAELLAVAGGSLQEVVATATEDRFVFRRGRLVERTRVLREDITSPDQGGLDA
ncbi:MAG: amidohydrolase family protein [Thermoleophilaceae bacterium]|nr:amidohydrolase family protein [Thermoleophilaceae bacterium]